MQPLIGITAYKRLDPNTGWQYDVCYSANAKAVQLAGGLPVLIPYNLDEATLHAIYDRLDGVLLPGGGDISPNNYGTASMTDLKEVDENRDRVEISLARWAVGDDLPLLGICRGHQLLNVSQGGTLIQDIPSLVKTELRHDISNSEPRSTILHSIAIDESSQLAGILGGESVQVNSLHHQAIDRLGEGLIVSARAGDGTIEALEIPEKSFAMSVQWHPEDLIENDPRMLELFKRFVAVARQRLESRMGI